MVRVIVEEKKCYLLLLGPSSAFDRLFVCLPLEFLFYRYFC
jgi:hypothetical protein